MTKSPVTRALEELIAYTNKALIQIKWLEDNEEWLNRCPFKSESLYDSPRIVVHNIAELHAARTFLRVVALGSWEDEYKYAFYSCGRAIAVFNSDNYPNISIWLECRPEDFPPELLNKGCEWVKSESINYNLICPTDN